MDGSPTEFKCRPIGYLESWFKTKNGTPRQAVVCPTAKAKLTVLKSVFTNPDHSLLNLEEFSYVWLIFVFHKNTETDHCKAKVSPPRLNGKRVGVFSTRSPHRPNPVGLTLAKLEQVEGATIYLSGVDILNGTPILDIKPYIPMYDKPDNPVGLSDQQTFQQTCATLQDGISDISTASNLQEPRAAEWIASLATPLAVRFTSSATEQLQGFYECGQEDSWYLKTPAEARSSIVDILRADPRSVYRRNQCQDRLYYLTVDKLHLTCWFDNDCNIVEVLKIQSAAVGVPILETI